MHSLFEYYLTPKLDEIASKYFGPNVPPIRILEQRTVLAFVSTTPVMDYAIPLPQNVIPISGVHIKEPKTLPEVKNKSLPNKSRIYLIYLL